MAEITPKIIPQRQVDEHTRAREINIAAAFGQAPIITITSESVDADANGCQVGPARMPSTGPREMQLTAQELVALIPRAAPLLVAIPDVIDELRRRWPELVALRAAAEGAAQ